MWSGGYRFGFNGMEKDDEIKGTGNSYDFGLRHYDPRIAKMFSVDPRASEYPWQSAYVYHRNSPILYVDYLGGGDPPMHITNLFITTFEEGSLTKHDVVKNFIGGTSVALTPVVIYGAAFYAPTLGAYASATYSKAVYISARTILNTTHAANSAMSWLAYNMAHNPKVNNVAGMAVEVFLNSISGTQGTDNPFKGRYNAIAMALTALANSEPITKAQRKLLQEFADFISPHLEAEDSSLDFETPETMELPVDQTSTLGQGNRIIPLIDLPSNSAEENNEDLLDKAPPDAAEPSPENEEEETG